MIDPRQQREKQREHWVYAKPWSLCGICQGLSGRVLRGLQDSNVYLYIHSFSYRTTFRSLATGNSNCLSAFTSLYFFTRLQVGTFFPRLSTSQGITSMMFEYLEQYSNLSSSSPRSDVADILDSIIKAPPFSFTQSTRNDLIRAILQDLSVPGMKSRLALKDAAQALLAVKTLGKEPSGSDFLSSPANLSTLLSLAATFKDDLEASSEALRCIANALLLIEWARSTFIEKAVSGGQICLGMLEKANGPDRIFILSRILFLCTASRTSYIKSIVEEKHHGRTVVEIIAAKLDSLTVAIQSGTKMAREAMSDLLKLTFNLLLYYPKLSESEPQNSDTPNDGENVMGDFWNPKLDGLLPPLLRVFSSLPPTFPSPLTAPLTHVIHSLITIPITPALRPVWFAVPATQSSRDTLVTTPKASSTSQRTESSTPSSRSDSPTRYSPTAPKLSTLDRALSVLAVGRKSLSRSPSPNLSATADIVQRTFDLLEVSFSHYFPGDIDGDDVSVRERCKEESMDSLDDILSPLIVLVTRLCLADETCRVRVRQWIVPDDLDRSSALESRPDLLGRCLRLLSSVYHPRLKDSVGEMLFAVSDSNATTLSALFGYGNVAGFLFHKGVMSAPAQDPGSSNASLTTSSGTAIDPITGKTVELTPSLSDMTDDEKMHEMEKLFVLFDRLEKSGALAPANNPVRKAMERAP